MNARRRHGPSSTDQGIYLGPKQMFSHSAPAASVPGTFDPARSSLESAPPQAVPTSQSQLGPPAMGASSGQDRTSEFLAACKSMKGRHNGAYVDGQNNRTLRQMSEFSLMAKRIGRDLSNTFGKLEKLTFLTKNMSLQDEKSGEIGELTYIIKQDINSLNKQIAQLQAFVRSRGAQNGRHAQSHASTVVVALQSRLAGMSNEFKSVLEVRTESLRQMQRRKEQFSQSSSMGVPFTPVTGHGLAAMQDDGSLGGQVSIDMDTQRSPQAQLLAKQESYIQERTDAMSAIQSTIVELGSIFQQLAHMVTEQEETIQRIDSSIEDTQLNVEGAHTEILKYFRSVSSNRWLMIKLFAILILIFIIVAMFLG
ncbi:syntaxin-5-like [Lampetra fluviatilis]